MKNFTISLIACFLVTAALTQPAANVPPLDKSPMDMSYYPANYPVLKNSGQTDGTPCGKGNL